MQPPLGEIIEHRYDWEVHRDEALARRSLKKKQVVEAFDRWINPESKACRKLSVHVIGTSDGQASLGRPMLSDCAKEMIDNGVREFHEWTENKDWGRVYE